MYRTRTRRHHRATILGARRQPALITARTLLDRLGLGDDFAARYASQITRTARRLGITPAARTWTRHNGRQRPTAAYDLATQALDLIRTVIAYKRTAEAFGLTA